MPIPLLVWGAIAAGSAFAIGGGGYTAGREIGKGIGQAIPLAAGSLLVYAIYTATKK